MTLEEAKKIVSNMQAYVGDGYNEDSITIDGSLTVQELKALLVVVEALGVNFTIEDQQ